MDNEEKINYWIELAGYDLESAKSMYNTGIYLNPGFICRQVVEKLLKAYYWKTLQDEPPFTDDLTVLSEESALNKKYTEEQKDFLDFLKPLKSRMRFTENQSEMLSSSSKEQYQEIITKTEDFYKWIIQLIH